MIDIDVDSIGDWYHTYKQKKIEGRYVTLKSILPILNDLSEDFLVEKIGTSFLKQDIHKVTFGRGEAKVLIWSQMHGNEATGTKAMLDLFQFFTKQDGFELLASQILENCTIVYIPILNPDGAEQYTRVNAQNIDLNRDVLALEAEESKVLQKVLKDFNPDYCFNLHDQRTIFTVGNTKKTATLSFLAPSVNESREVTTSRIETMRTIVAINNLVQKVIPGNVGRYTDEFYPTATGDNFQKAGHYTVLFEAGHTKDDYSREKVRYYNFLAILQGLNYIASTNKQSIDYTNYNNIPNNTQYYLDKIYKKIYVKSSSKIVDIGVVYKEELNGNTVKFIPEIKFINNLDDYNANSIVDMKGIEVESEENLKEIINLN